MRQVPPRIQASSYRNSLQAAVLAALCAALCARPAEAAADAAGSKPGPVPPNFVVLLADDMGWADLACYGNAYHETPNIDRLARQGMRFTDAYAACPVCSPTRASVLTGKYPATLNLTDYIPGHPRPWAKLIVPEFNQQLPASEVTFAEALKERGYASAAFGKWHLGPKSHYPDTQGFDRFVVTGGDHLSPRNTSDPSEKFEPGQTRIDYLTSLAEQFLEEHRGHPFALYLAYHMVHIPLQADPALIEKYERKPKPASGVNHPVYAAMMEHVDLSVGRLMKALEELNLAENTVVIFVSDNGGLFKRFDGEGPEVTSNAPLRDEKGSLYEGGIRVPLIVRWPGVVPAERVEHEPVASIDFFPTMLEFAGIDRDKAPAVDGVSLVDQLRGSGTPLRRALFWHYPHYHHTAPAGAVRESDYKLIEYFEDGRLELYHLQDDPGESRNLVEKMPEKAESLRALLAGWRESIGAKMPRPNPDYDPQKAHVWGHRLRR